MFRSFSLFRWFENLVDPFQPYPYTPPSDRIWPYIRASLPPFRKIIIVSIIFSVLSAGFEIAIIGYSGYLLTQLANTPKEIIWQELGFELIAVATAIMVLRPLIGFINETLDDVALKPSMVGLVRWRAHKHVLKQPVSWFRDQTSGILGNRTKEIGIAVGGAVYQVTHTLTNVLTYLLGSMWLMSQTDALLVVPIVFWGVLYVAHTAYIVPRFRDHYEAFNKALADISGHLVDSYANIEIIKLFTDPAHEDALNREKFQSVKSSFVGLQKFEVLTNVGMLALGTILMIGLVGYAIFLWQTGHAEIGAVAAALALSLRLHTMAEWMIDSVAALFGYLGQIRDSMKSVAQPLTFTDKPNAPALKLTDGAISIDNVTHAYGREKSALHGLNLEIKPGEKLGLVGPSGGGKSTIVNLLMRHFDPDQGSLFIDGQNIRLVKHESLLEQIAIVPQEPSLLNRSISENIGYGRDTGIKTIQRAAEQAGAHEFILDLVDHEGRCGYSAHVGERGIKLSGGQKQRIALARAILKDAPILILDEATSALDTETETHVLNTLYKLMEERTVIAIAHRLSTIAKMDRIAVLDQGKIIELGTQDELLAMGGIYHRMWRQSAHSDVDGFIGSEIASISDG